MKPLNSGNLSTYLNQFSRRLRWRDIVSLTQKTLCVPFLVVSSIQVAARLLPLEQGWLWSLAFLLTYILILSVFSLLRSLPPLKVARRVDLELGLKERLSTAVVLNSSTHSQFATKFPPELVDRQNRDALGTAAAINPHQALNFHWHLRPLLVAGVLAVCSVTLAFLPNPMDAVRAEREAIAKAAQVEADRIEELRQEVANSEHLSPQDREELLRLLQELAEALRQNRGDQAEALAEISKVEEALRQRLDPTAGLRQAALDSLAAQMRSLAGIDPSEKAGLADAAEALEKLAVEL
ncbi:MAG: hypothetical protein ACNA8H_07690, partial [Anaerolineales bacterium]